MHEGKFGELPDWYLLMKAAHYLGVAPWELEQRSPWYIHHALSAESATIEAQNKREEKEERRRKQSARGKH